MNIPLLHKVGMNQESKIVNGFWGVTNTEKIFHEYYTMRMNMESFFGVPVETIKTGTN